MWYHKQELKSEKGRAAELERERAATAELRRTQAGLFSRHSTPSGAEPEKTQAAAVPDMLDKAKPCLVLQDAFSKQLPPDLRQAVY